jgi:hypothetical protein
MPQTDDDFMRDLKRRLERACIADRGGLRAPTVDEVKSVDRVTVREGQGMADYRLKSGISPSRARRPEGGCGSPPARGRRRGDGL